MGQKCLSSSRAETVAQLRNTEPQVSGVGDRQWLYQTCTEFGFCKWPKPKHLTDSLNSCNPKSIWPERVNSHWYATHTQTSTENGPSFVLPVFCTRMSPAFLSHWASNLILVPLSHCLDVLSSTKSYPLCTLDKFSVFPFFTSYSVVLTERPHTTARFQVWS